MKKSNGEMVEESEKILEALSRHWEEFRKSKPEGTVTEEEGETPDVVGSFDIIPLESKLGGSGWCYEDVAEREKGVV